MCGLSPLRHRSPPLRFRLHCGSIRIAARHRSLQSGRRRLPQPKRLRTVSAPTNDRTVPVDVEVWQMVETSLDAGWAVRIYQRLSSQLPRDFITSTRKERTDRERMASFGNRAMNPPQPAAHFPGADNETRSHRLRERVMRHFDLSGTEISAQRECCVKSARRRAAYLR